jgi:hypothetical protein
VIAGSLAEALTDADIRAAAATLRPLLEAWLAHLRAEGGKSVLRGVLPIADVDWAWLHGLQKIEHEIESLLLGRVEVSLPLRTLFAEQRQAAPDAGVTLPEALDAVPAPGAGDDDAGDHPPGIGGEVVVPDLALHSHRAADHSTARKEGPQ